METKRYLKCKINGSKGLSEKDSFWCLAVGCEEKKIGSYNKLKD